MAVETLNRIKESYRRLILVMVLNVPLIFGILLLNLKGVEFSVLTWVYFFTVALGYYALFILITSSLAFLLLCWLRKLALAAAISVIAVSIFFLLIDGFVYHVTRIHIDPFWMKWIINDFSAFGIPASTMRAVAFCMLGLILFEIAAFALAGKIHRRRGIALLFIFTTVIAFASSQVIHLVAYEKNAAYITTLTPRLPVYYPVTSHKNAQKYGDILPIQEEMSSFVSAGRKSSIAYPLNEIKYDFDSKMTEPNILFILYESWRYDAMTPEVTPNTYALGRKSTVCLDHYSSGNSTVAGLFGLFYGLHSTYWSEVKAENALIDNPVLIDVLKEKNYSFGIFARSNFERHKIKDAIFRDIEIHKSFAGKNHVDQDRDMNMQLLAFLRKQKEMSRPFMALAFYKSNHAPYWYPPEDSVFLPAGDQNLILADENTDPAYYFNDYLNATHYVDRLVGEILEEIDSLGYLSNTIIVVTTDHGEEFNDDHSNYWGHGSNFTMFQTRVPMIIYIPDREPQKLEYRTSHIDIPPTILQNYLGCVNDVHDYSNGRNLFRNGDGRRSLVIGSYVNHAFVIDDNVYEIFPFRTKSYKIDDINAEGTKPSFEKVKTVFDEISRFYREPEIRPKGQADLIEGDTLLSRINLNR